MTEFRGQIPRGFQGQMNRIVRAVLLSRPLHVRRFVSEYLSAELDKRTLCTLQFEGTMNQPPTINLFDGLADGDVARRISDEVLRTASEEFCEKSVSSKATTPGASRATSQAAGRFSPSKPTSKQSSFVSKQSSYAPVSRHSPAISQKASSAFQRVAHPKAALGPPTADEVPWFYPPDQPPRSPLIARSAASYASRPGTSPDDQTWMQQGEIEAAIAAKPRSSPYRMQSVEPPWFEEPDCLSPGIAAARTVSAKSRYSDMPESQMPPEIQAEGSTRGVVSQSHSLTSLQDRWFKPISRGSDVSIDDGCHSNMEPATPTEFYRPSSEIGFYAKPPNEGSGDPLSVYPNLTPSKEKQFPWFQDALFKEEDHFQGQFYPSSLYPDPKWTASMRQTTLKKTPSPLSVSTRSSRPQSKLEKEEVDHTPIPRSPPAGEARDDGEPAFIEYSESLRLFAESSIPPRPPAYFSPGYESPAALDLEQDEELESRPASPVYFSADLASSDAWYSKTEPTQVGFRKGEEEDVEGVAPPLTAVREIREEDTAAFVEYSDNLTLSAQCSPRRRSLAYFSPGKLSPTESQLELNEELLKQPYSPVYFSPCHLSPNASYSDVERLGSSPEQLQYDSNVMLYEQTDPSKPVSPGFSTSNTGEQDNENYPPAPTLQPHMTSSDLPPESVNFPDEEVPLEQQDPDSRNRTPV